MGRTRSLQVVLFLTAVQVFMHVYDWTLHVEDLDWVPVSVPWQAPHATSGGLQVFDYTVWWSGYWGLASLFSLICLVLLVDVIYRGDDQ